MVLWIWTTSPSLPRPEEEGSHCSPRGSGIWSSACSRGGEPATGVGGQRASSSQRSRKVVSTSWTAGAPDGDLDVVPRRFRPCSGAICRGLGIARVGVVIPTSGGGRALARRRPGSGRRGAAAPRTSGGGHHRCELACPAGIPRRAPQVLPSSKARSVEAELAPVRPPQQPAHVDPASAPRPGRRRVSPASLSCSSGSPRQSEVRSGHPHPSPRSGRRVGEMRSPVHQRGHLVAEAPRWSHPAHVVDTGVRIASLEAMSNQSPRAMTT